MYTSNKKISGLDPATVAEQDDLHVIGDTSDSGRAKKITEEDLEDTIANSDNFVNELIANETFTTGLANDPNFIDELTQNTTFQNNINNFITPSGGSSRGGSSSKPMNFLPTVTPNSADLVSYYSDVEAFVSVSKMTNTTLQIQAAPSINFTRDLSIDWADVEEIRSVVIKANFIYVLLCDTSTGDNRVYRYLASDDSAAGILMTISGASFGSIANMIMTSDGVYFYFNYDAGNSADDNDIAKFAVASTTLTYASTTIMAAGTGYFFNFLVSLSGKYFGFNTSGNHILEYSTSGALLVTTGENSFVSNFPLVNFSNTFYSGWTNADTTGYEFFKIYVPDTDSSSANTLISAIAANDLTAGDKVGVSDMVGDSVDIVQRANLSHTIPNFTASKGAGVQIATNKIFIAYRDSSSGNLMGVACTTNKYGMIITAGTPVQIAASGSFVTGSQSACSHATNAASVVYANGSTIVVAVCTVSTLAVTVGTPVVAYTDASQVSNPRICTVDANKIIASSNGSSRSNYIVATISGTVPTFGTKFADATHYLINSTDGVFYEFQFISAGIVIQAGIDSIDTSGGASNHKVVLGVRVISVSGTVPTLNTILTASTGHNYQTGAGVNHRGNIALISSTAIAFCIGLSTSSPDNGYFAVFADFTGTTTSHILSDYNSATTASGTGSNPNVWVHNNKSFFMLSSLAANGGNNYGPIVQYTYASGASFTFDGTASTSAQFAGMLIPVDDYVIGFGTGQLYMFSGVSTLSFLGYPVSNLGAGSTGSIMIDGEDSNQVNLIPGRVYQAAAGGTLVLGTNDNEFYAGKAFNQTTIIKD